MALVLGDNTGNVLLGTNGADLMQGLGGDDRLVGSPDADILDGGADTDTADYSGSAASVTVNLATGSGSGGLATGDSYISIENIIGSNNGDTLTGDGEDNEIEGRAGNDTLIGGLGADTLDGGADFDTADYSASTSAITISSGSGYGGHAAGDTLISIEEIIGSNHDDTIGYIGFFVDLEAHGGAGDDIFNAGGASYTYYGELGNDTFNIGDAAASYVDGGNNTDTVDYGLSNTGVSVDLLNETGDGGDTLISIENVKGTIHDDTLIGDNFSNELHGFGGDDVIAGLVGADHLDGGADTDTVTYAASTAGVTVDLEAGTGSGRHASGDTVLNFENIIGSAHADTLYGTAGDNVFTGNGGDDIFHGRGGADFFDGGSGTDGVSYIDSAVGLDRRLTDITRFDSIENLQGSLHNDTLWGDAGNNRLLGMNGNDVLRGLAGADDLLGGLGTDTANYEASNALVNVNLELGTGLGGHAQGDTLTSIENVTGSNFEDMLTGDALSNRLAGRDGNDTLSGLDGDDELIGGAGDDHLIGGDGDDHLTGGTGEDVLDGGLGIDRVSYEFSGIGVMVDLRVGMSGSGGDAEGDTFISIEQAAGSAHDDMLTGNILNNRLEGLDGNDTLAGMSGDDILAGGLGDDIFIFADGHGADTIEDFDATGGDLIDLSGLSAFAAFADLSVPGVMAQDGGDVIITFSATECIRLVNVQLADLDASDFDF